MAYLNDYLEFTGFGGEMLNYTDIMNETIKVKEVGASLFISKSQLPKVTAVIAVYIIPTFCLLGSVGNIMSFRVLFNVRMRNQTNYILAALCISDTLFLIHSLIYCGLNIYKKKNPIQGEALRAYVYPIVGAYGSIVTARITSCLTTLLCAERFVAVFYPMQAKTICSKRNTGIAIGIIYLTTLLLFIPFTLKYEAVSNHVNETFTFVSMNTTSFFENNQNFYKIYGTILNVIFRFAPLVIIPILNIKMIRTVKMTWKLRRHMSANSEGLQLTSIPGSQLAKSTRSNDQTRITIMLLVVSFVFVTCIMPGALNSLATHFSDPYGRMGKDKTLYMFISAITYLLETINSSVNFIIYIALSRKFRALYIELCCCGHGQYYRKISLSSVKERFKWSTNRKRSSSSDTDQYRRRAVSDVGPLIDDNKWKNKSKRMMTEAHSDGFGAPNGTSFSLEDYVALHDMLKQNGSNSLKREKSSRPSLKKILCPKIKKSDTTVSLNLDNGNNVSCSLTNSEKNSVTFSKITV